MVSYVTGGIVSGLIIHYVQFQVFYFISLAMLGILSYDFAKTYIPFFRNKKEHETNLKMKLDKIQDTIKNTTTKKNKVLSESK